MDEAFEKRLDAEYEAYLRELYTLPVSEVIQKAKEIACTKSIYNYLKHETVPEKQIAYLAQFKYPLTAAAACYAQRECNAAEQIAELLSNVVEQDVFRQQEKAADFKVIFVRKPLIISTLREDVKWMKAHAFQVEKVVELTERQFAYFSSNLGEAMLFIELDKNCMYEQDGCTHCLLVTTPTRGEGILVDAEGYDHARYAAYIPDCSRLALDGVPTDRYSDVPPIKARRKQPSLER